MLCALFKSRKQELAEIAKLFLRMGFTAFGGPAAHISMMDHEFVRRRGWLTRQEFLDLLGAVNLIPGPNSTEMAIFVGYRRAGWLGLILAGSCFILPAALIVSALAWAYLRYGKLPAVEGLFYAMKPVIIAIIAQALWGLGRTALKTWPLAVLGLGAGAASYVGFNPVLVLVVAGFVMALSRGLFSPKAHLLSLSPLLGVALPAAGAAASAATPFSLWALFLFFLKVGSVLFGSGYVLLAFLRDDLVVRWGWLTEPQLLDAVAVGQFTPGPVFTTATFIGYLLGGPLAAMVATIDIFLPSFLLVALSGPLVPRLRKSRVAGAFLDGVNVASLALMAVVTLQLAKAGLVDWLTILLAAASLFVLIRYKVNSAWLVLAAAAIGLARVLLLAG